MMGGGKMKIKPISISWEFDKFNGETLDDIIFDQVVKISIYHSLNEEVVKNCGKSLPYPFTLYLDGLLDHYSLSVWLKANEEIYQVRW